MNFLIRMISRCMHAKSVQSCLTPCNPMACSLLGSSVHGILQARILEWVATPSSKRSSQLRIKPVSLPSTCTGQWVLQHQHHLGSPLFIQVLFKFSTLFYIIPFSSIFYSLRMIGYEHIMTLSSNPIQEIKILVLFCEFTAFLTDFRIVLN